MGTLTLQAGPNRVTPASEQWSNRWGGHGNR